MGRIKFDIEKKKKSISIALDKSVYESLDELNVKNKSKLVNWLIKEHFGIVLKEKDRE